MSNEDGLVIPRDADGNVNFLVLPESEHHEIMLLISKELNKCRKCPVEEGRFADDKTHLTVEERQELCGDCPTYKAMRELHTRLPDYDLSKRQCTLLNKGKDMTAEDIEELFYSGVQKLVIAQCLGFPIARNAFATYLKKQGVVLPNKHKHDYDVMQEYLTKCLEVEESEA